MLPFRHGLGIDEEDGLRVSLRGAVRESVVAPPHGEDVLRVAVCAVPLMSNFTDVDALAAEPGVVVRFVDRPEELADADLVVRAGHARHRAGAGVAARARARGRAARGGPPRGGPVLGICGGFQILGEHIEDEVGVAGRARSTGSGCCPYGCGSPARRPWPGRSARRSGEPVEGYEIHHGVAEVHGGEAYADFLDGCRVGAGVGHALARLAGERRLPAGLPARGGRRRGPRASYRPPTPRSPRCARSSWTGSAT